MYVGIFVYHVYTYVCICNEYVYLKLPYMSCPAQMLQWVTLLISSVP